jgi:hypothetical protein
MPLDVPGPSGGRLRALKVGANSSRHHAGFRRFSLKIRAERDATMKSLLQKTVYAGLGLLGSGKQTIDQLGRELSKKANLSEKEGQKVARQLRSRSEKAIKSLRKTLDAEVNKVVHALHVATTEDVANLSAKAGKAKPAKKPARRRPAKPSLTP